MFFSQKIISGDSFYALLFALLVNESGQIDQNAALIFFNAYEIVKSNIRAVIQTNRVAVDDELVDIGHQLYYLHSTLDIAYENSGNHNFLLLSKRLAAIKEQFSTRHPFFIFKFVAQKKSLETYQDALLERQAIEQRWRAMLDPSN